VVYVLSSIQKLKVETIKKVAKRKDVYHSIYYWVFPCRFVVHTVYSANDDDKYFHEEIFL